MDNVLKINKITVVGELVENNLEITKTADKTYIAGNLVVKSVVNGVEQLTPVHFFANELKKDNTPNSMFKSYSEADKYLNKRVSIAAEIDENRFYNEQSNQIHSSNRVKGIFINDARTNQVDGVDFSFTGFVAAPLSERLNQKGELLFYEITLGQVDWTGEKPTYVKFIVRDRNIASAVADLYDRGITTTVYGSYAVESETSVVEKETAFGAPVVNEYTSVFKNFVITAGDYPLTDKAYTPAQVEALMKAYVDAEAEIIQKAKTRDAASKIGGNISAPVKDSSTSAKSSLKGLL